MRWCELRPRVETEPEGGGARKPQRGRVTPSLPRRNPGLLLSLPHHRQSRRQPLRPPAGLFPGGGGIFIPSAPTRSAPGLPAPLQVARRGAHLTRRLHPRRSNSIQVPAAVRRARAHPEPLRLQPRRPLPTALRSEAPGGFPVGKTTLAQARRPTPWCPLPRACPRPQSRSIARPPRSPPEGRGVRELAPGAPQSPRPRAPVGGGSPGAWGAGPGGGVSAAAAPYLAQALSAGLGEGGDPGPADRRRADFIRPGEAVGGGRGGRRRKGFVSASRPPSAPARAIPLPQPPSRTLERWGGGAKGAKKAPARPGSTPALPPAPTPYRPPCAPGRAASALTPAPGAPEAGRRAAAES